MKTLILTAMLLSPYAVCCAADVAPGAAARQDIEAAASLDSLLRVRAPVVSDESGIRTTLLRDAGRKLGFRAGMRARGAVIARQLDARAAALDKMFQFSTLVSEDGVLPPVVDQAMDVANFATGQVRTADLVLRIAREERFVAVPPTWRDYLLTGLVFKNVDLPDPDARPKNDVEAETWRQAVSAGWKDGGAQADAILAANFNRLTRDYTGMLTYSALLQQGMIRRTKVGEGVRAVAGDGAELHIGERLRRIVTRAALETDEGRWHPGIVSASDPKPPVSTETGPVVLVP
ncbi:type IV secretory system conjugative DNA transfer family protein [Rugamonas apoptosis]|uniref:Type IV secretory system conjugative DNA transfer family protein n=1 Tax=Rugamonas apoptosis TaxID=2758570 RepID=A0A7W2F8U8_9BURK|nr:type IV secretory system conjugative DNA transfer family protein [Rugamonas apoptosis]MBA5687230.1 type IV secretory system conjugative DNA transfer family protein [Rugamonas apoptosis]